MRVWFPSPVICGNDSDNNPQDLLDRGVASGDLYQSVLAKRPHTLSNGRLGKLLGRGPFDGHSLNFFRHVHEFVNGQPAPVSGPTAGRASLGSEQSREVLTEFLKRPSNVP